MEIISREEARLHEQSIYFTGKPCKRGHICFRFTKQAHCSDCRKEDNAAYYSENTDQVLARVSRWNKDHFEQATNTQKARRKRNPQKYNKIEKERWKRDHVKMSLAVKIWFQANPERVRYYHGKRRAAKLNALPLWANLEAINQIYINCPEGFSVDHVLPLQGKLICGLHVPENLQYLTPSENSSKRNHFAPYIQSSDGSVIFPEAG